MLVQSRFPERLFSACIWQITLWKNSPNQQQCRRSLYRVRQKVKYSFFFLLIMRAENPRGQVAAAAQTFLKRIRLPVIYRAKPCPLLLVTGTPTALPYSVHEPS